MGFAFVGTILIAYGSFRRVVVERALERGEFSQPAPWVLLALTGLGVALGLLTLALVLISS